MEAAASIGGAEGVGLACVRDSFGASGTAAAGISAAGLTKLFGSDCLSTADDGGVGVLCAPGPIGDGFVA